MEPQAYEVEIPKGSEKERIVSATLKIKQPRRRSGPKPAVIIDGQHFGAQQGNSYLVFNIAAQARRDNGARYGMQQQPRRCLKQPRQAIQTIVSQATPKVNDGVEDCRSQEVLGSQHDEAHRQGAGDHGHRGGNGCPWTQPVIEQEVRNMDGREN